METAATPWKAIHELRRLSWSPVGRLYFAWHGVRWGAGWRIYGMPTIQRHRGSRMIIGDDFEVRNWHASNPLGVDRPCLLATWSAEAVLEIGRGVRVSGGAICARQRVQIGDEVTIGPNCTIVDSDFHPIGLEKRLSHFALGSTAPVIIEDGAFIGMRVLILKGSRIGRGSVVGAGSVVAGEIPARVLAAGNPARVVRTI